MPYRGKSVSLEEMLDILTGHGRTEAVAVLELERALEDKAIILILRDGSDHEGEALYRALSDTEMSAVISLLRDIPNRTHIPSMRAWNAPIAMFRAARAIRMQFETVCGLVDAQPAPSVAGVPMSRKDAVRACIERGMVPASTTTWDAFCEQVRDLADGWIDKKEGTTKRGFEEKTIKRDVKETMN
jgi:hypothetical protein